ncbi:MAG: ROK family protein [Hyphomicrobiales bacterium]
MADRWFLLADVGASNCRFAISTAPRVLTLTRGYPTAATATFEETLERFFKDAGLEAGDCAGAVLAAAGPVADNAVTLTNAPWTLDGKAIRRRIGGAPVKIVNDLEAVALLLPYVEVRDSLPLWQPAGPPLHGGRIAVNVGTGFGAAAAVPAGEGWSIVAGEAGHMSLASPNGDCVEDLLSGAGVPKLYAALGGSDTLGDGALVFARAAVDPVAARVVKDLAEALGRVAGDLVLALGAWGGVWLCGSVALRLAEVADPLLIRSAFEAKGAMTDRMRRVPVNRLTLAEPALTGLSYAAASLNSAE